MKKFRNTNLLFSQYELTNAIIISSLEPSTLDSTKEKKLTLKMRLFLLPKHLNKNDNRFFLNICWNFFPNSKSLFCNIYQTKISLFIIFLIHTLFIGLCFILWEYEIRAKYLSNLKFIISIIFKQTRKKLKLTCCYQLCLFLNLIKF